MDNDEFVARLVHENVKFFEFLTSGEELGYYTYADVHCSNVISGDEDKRNILVAERDLVVDNVYLPKGCHFYINLQRDKEDWLKSTLAIVKI